MKGFIASLVLVAAIVAAYIVVVKLFGQERIDFALCPLCERPVEMPRHEIPLHPGTP
jgi:hypothetical protein